MLINCFTMIAMGYTENGPNIYTSWLITTSGDTLMQSVPYLEQLALLLEGENEKIKCEVAYQLTVGS